MGQFGRRMTPYSASKAGVVSLTRSAARMLARHRITSNCVCPGAVETPMWEQSDREGGALEGLGQGEAWKRRIRGIPLGRPERPEDTSPTWWRSWPAPTPTT